MRSPPRLIVLVATMLGACSGDDPGDKQGSSDSGSPVEDDSRDTDTDTDTDTEEVDADGDGYSDEVDCDDDDPEVSPGATEICNGFDDNCNGLTDEEDDTLSPVGLLSLTIDADGDGFGVDGTETLRCELTDGFAEFAGDCNDAEYTVNPGAPEACGSGFDDDCDGTFGVGCGVLAIGEDAEEPEASTRDLHEAEISPTSAIATELFAVGFDLDGDGVEDALVGDPNQDEGRETIGVIHVLWGDSELDWGDSDAADRLPVALEVGLESSSENWMKANFIGGRMTRLDDVSGNGLPDLAILSEFGVWIVESGSVERGTTSSVHEAAAASVYLYTPQATDVVNAGDIDDDGRAELVVPMDQNGGVRLFWGEDLALDVHGEIGLEIRQTGLSCGGFGNPGTTAGLDFDGDGFSDLVTGCPNTHSYRGEVALFAGSELSMERSGIIGPTSDNLCVTGVSSDPGTKLGRLVVSGGDLNHDGYPDLVISEGEDRMLLFQGGAERFSSDTGHCGLDPLEPSDADSSLKVPGGGSESRSSSHATALDDVTGDGIDDLMVVVRVSSGSAGKAAVFAGDPAGVDESHSFLVQAVNGTYLHQGVGVDLGGTGVPSLVFPSSHSTTSLRVLSVEGY